MQHNRKPFQTEITDEVAKEYTRQQTEKRKAALQKGSDIDDMRTRVVDMEGSVTRLEEKVGESHMRLEDMFKAIMTAQGCTPPVFRQTSETAAKSAENGQPGQNISEGNRTRSLSRADFLHPATLFPEDISAVLTQQTGVQSEPKETASEKQQTDEFLEGLLQDPDSTVHEKRDVPRRDLVHQSSGSAGKGDAVLVTDDITAAGEALPEGASDSDTSDPQQVTPGLPICGFIA